MSEERMKDFKDIVIEEIYKHGIEKAKKDKTARYSDLNYYDGLDDAIKIIREIYKEVIGE